jgi:hypothetical protein
MKALVLFYVAVSSVFYLVPNEVLPILENVLRERCIFEAWVKQSLYIISGKQN